MGGKFFQFSVRIYAKDSDGDYRSFSLPGKGCELYTCRYEESLPNQPILEGFEGSYEALRRRLLDLSIAEKDVDRQRVLVQLSGERLIISDDASFKEALYRQIYTGKTIFSMILEVEPSSRSMAESLAPLSDFRSRNKPVKAGSLAAFQRLPAVLFSLLPTACCMTQSQSRVRKQQR